jgi:DNA-directed RNA polymerase subunit RPC12/RpoP
MKQGKCIKCKIRWVSDKNMGKTGKARCPECSNLLKTTSCQLSWSVKIHPKASDKYRIKVRKAFMYGNKIYPGYGY